MSKFKEIGVSKDLCQGINEMGFINPTEVQEKSIPFLLFENRDLISLAQTGTGKTAAFGLPVIQKTVLKNNFVQYIILLVLLERLKKIFVHQELGRLDQAGYGL